MSDYLINGNIEGLKKSIIQNLEALYEISNDNDLYAEEELINIICDISSSVNREIAVYINSKGKVTNVIVGTHKTVSLSYDMDKGSRCIHTHPSSNGRLSPLDISTLKKTDLYAMSSIGIKNGKMTSMYCAFVDSTGKVKTYGPYTEVNQTDEFMIDMEAFAADSVLKKHYDKERVLAVGVNTTKEEALLDELEELIITAGGQCIDKIVQNRTSIDVSYYIGKGKLLEISHLCQLYDIDTVIFDDPLTVGQQRNIENVLNLKVLDRTALILDIFAKRAFSREGKIQVELAQLNYIYPRLSGKGSMMSRLGGGIGTRGPGETKLETDRRHILRKINHLKKAMKKVDSRRNNLRSSRKNKNFHMFAVAGYTNVGKSTLINVLTESEVFAKDMLFATLDPSVRGIELPSGTKALLVDTVGFISKLPHELVEAFKSTLEEVTLADTIIHVIDSSDKEVESHMETVYNIFNELGAKQMPVVEVINKIDIGSNTKIPNFQNRQRVYVSALTGEGLDQLKYVMDNIVNGPKHIIEIQIPYKDSHILKEAYDQAEVIEKKYESEYIYLKLKVNKNNADIFEKYYINN